MISHDTNIKKYLCELCGKSYKYCWSLDAHNLTHSKSKSYKCSKCNKVFNNWNTLKRHQLSHTGMNLFYLLNTLMKILII